nr:hypothetical protein XACLD7_13960006 [Xanthomonas citri pv. citri]
MRHERVVRAGTGHFQNLDGAPGEIRGAPQHVQELLLGHQAGTRERGEQAAGLDHAQGQLVHVQILLQRRNHLLAVAGHLGRVQDHHIELLAAVGRIAQPRKDVGLHELGPHVVELGVALGNGDHVFVDVHAQHFGRTARGGIHRKAAGVAAQVQHALAFDLLAQPLTVVALVGEETGLVRTGRVGAELDAVLGDHRRFGGGVAVEIEAFLLLHMFVGKAVEAAAGELFAQRLVDPFAVTEHAGGEELHHHQVAVAVHHQAGQAVAFAMHHAPGVGHAVELEPVAAQAHRCGDLAREPARVHRHRPVGFQDAHGNARMAVVEAAANPFPVHADHVDDAAGLGLGGGLFHQLLEDPRVAGAPGILETDDGDWNIHRPIVSGWIDVPAPGTQNRAQKGSSSQRCRRHDEPAMCSAPVQRQPARPVASETFAAQAKVRHPESTISVSQGLSPPAVQAAFTFSGFLCKPLATSGYGVASRWW